ncbi:DUF6152 family protein [Uliginosibacterium sp. H3]|uniref:DUF6152 family protein n=1 Tax=Uliginosibacterium silvisoli TaxID=3114758 RepID=A0ABU6K397_9RHOO|nr:DUF6152 family protein [Uliginosibacterium sp. H3]
MTRSSRTLLAVISCLLLATHMPASVAHHSFAMYDPSKPFTLTGTVKEFQWTSPHVLLWVVRDPQAGEKEGVLWSIELSTSPGPLSRIGWSKRSLVPGDRVAVEINPLRNGEPGGQFKKVTNIKTGEVLTTATPDAGSAPVAAPK